VQQFDQTLDWPLFAFQVGLDAAVGAVADPTGHFQLLCLLLGPGSEENALHAAGDADVAADEPDYSSVMSGASSAFMPTTL